MNFTLIWSLFFLIISVPLSAQAISKDTLIKFPGTSSLGHEQVPFTIKKMETKGQGIGQEKNEWEILLHFTQLKVTAIGSAGHKNLPQALKQGPLYKAQVDGLPQVQTPYKPALPFLSLLFIGHPKDFQVSWELGTPYSITPFLPFINPESPCRCPRDNKKHPFWDEAKISSLEEISRKAKEHPLVQWEYLGDFRGIPFSRMLIHPHRFDIEGKSLSVYPQLRIRLRQQSSRYGLGPLGDATSGAWFLKKYLQEVSPASRGLHIVTPAKWEQALEKFIQWKRKLGHQVTVKRWEEIGTTSDDLRNYFLQLHRDNDRSFHYVLLVGHEEQIPTFYRPTSTHMETPTDLPYFTWGGEDDFIPDVFYGRLSVDKEEEIESQVQKIIEYEKADYPTILSPGLRRGVGMASNEGSNPSDLEYLQQIERPFIDQAQMNFVNFHQDDPKSTPTMINEALSAGVTWLTYLGHGSGYSWDSLHSQGYTSQDVGSLGSAKVRPIIIDVSCQNGRFLYDHHLGERFMNESSSEGPLGAVAYYGGTVDITWDPPAIMARGISESYFSQDLLQLGETLLSGQLYLYTQYADKNAVKENLVWYALQGDPTMMIRTGALGEIRAILNTDESAIQLLDDQGRPLPHTSAIFYDSHGRHWRETTDEAGRIVLPSPLPAGISIMKKGFRHFEKRPIDLEVE